MATATRSRVAAATTLFATTVGKKIAMALSGAILTLFVFGHFFGNLKVFQGPESFNRYAEGLRSFGAPFFSHGELLWIVRVVLLAALTIHVVAAVRLYLRSRRARPVAYRKFESLAFSPASRSMAWGGVALLIFVVYHLLHLTFGTVHPDFVPGDAYHNFVAGFRVWPVSLAYVIAMVPLGLHLYHGIWSATQTLGSTSPAMERWRRPVAGVIAVIVAGGNILLALAVLTGLVR
jgi:succinate dehydrogenase / fumarate reductase cytochrome b subunit